MKSSNLNIHEMILKLETYSNEVVLLGLMYVFHQLQNVEQSLLFEYITISIVRPRIFIIYISMQ